MFPTITPSDPSGYYFPLGSRSLEMTGADLLGDSHPEVIVGDASPSLTIHDVHFPGGIFSQTLFTARPPHFIAVDDLDQDGTADDIIALGNIDGSSLVVPVTSVISVFRKPATVWLRQDIALTAELGRVFAADVTGDGFKDIVAGRVVWVNDGTGQFSSSFSPLVGNSMITELQPGDFDGDGDRDLIAVYYGNSSLGLGLVARILRHNPTHTFTLLPAVLLHAIGPSSSFSSIVDDMDGDGKSDVVTFSEASGKMTVRTMRGQVGPSLVGLEPFLSRIDMQGQYVRLYLADVDGNGTKDLVYPHSVGEDSSFAFDWDYIRPFILLNDGQGVFSPIRGAGFGALAATDDRCAFRPPYAIADFDLDGDVDVASWCFIDENSGGPRQLEVMHNTSSTAAPGVMLEFDSPGTTSHIPHPTFYGTLGGAAALMRMAPSGLERPRGQFVKVELIGDTTGAGFNGPLWLPTTEYDWVETEFVLGSNPGRLSLLFSTVEGVTKEIHLVNGAITEAVSGTPQGACAGAPFVQPLTAQFLDPFGVPIVGFRTQFYVTAFPTGGSSLGIGMQPISGVFVDTDALGRATVTATAGSLPGDYTVSVGFSYSSFDVVPFRLTVGTSVAVATIVDGDDQVTMLGRSFDRPLTVKVLDSSGAPLVGETVVFSVQSGGVVLGSTQALTDANGRALTTLSAGSSTGKAVVNAVAGIGSNVAVFDAFVRGLVVDLPTPTTLSIAYTHERPFLPILFCSDAPLPAPGYVATPFGDLYTSVLSPGPAFGYIDGYGIFGSDAFATLNNLGVFARSFNLAGLPSGIPYVLQLYLIDPNFDYPANIVVSNPFIGATP